MILEGDRAVDLHVRIPPVDMHIGDKSLYVAYRGTKYFFFCRPAMYPLLGSLQYHQGVANACSSWVSRGHGVHKGVRFLLARLLSDADHIKYIESTQLLLYYRVTTEYTFYMWPHYIIRRIIRWS